MSSHPGNSGSPDQARSGQDDKYSVDARGSMGVQIGEGNTQIIYTYNRLTWTDGVAPPPLVTVTGAIDSPYRGLSAFREQDAAFFFGREAATTELLERISRHLSLKGTSLVVVSGVSGAGKSSLLQAGVLPRIRGAGLTSEPGSASWPCLVFTPTRAPLDELALRVALLAGVDATAVRRSLDADPLNFALTARQAGLATPPGSRPDPERRAANQNQRWLLLIIDQFEQVFTQCVDEGQRQAFITALCAAASAACGRDHTPAALVVLSVRADFEGRCGDYPELAEAVQDRYLVTPMSERQLRIAITEPAKAAGSHVDNDLAEVLLTDARTRTPGVMAAGVLPLLSHALDQAWRTRTGKALTLADYERTGGIEGAVARSAQSAYDHLTPSQQAAARQVFTRLTATSSDGVDTADRASRADLTDGKGPAGARDVEVVLEAFAAERLLILAADTVEISHEVLLKAWPLLRDTWLAETHADRIVRTRLHNVAAEWARDSRDPSYLYGGSLLQAAAETADRINTDPARNPPLSQTERNFLHAASRAARRTTRRRQAVIAGLLALTLTAVTSAVFAAYNAANANRQHAIALSRQLATDALKIDSAHPVTARQLALAAWSISPTEQASSVISALLTEQQQDSLLPVTSSPNGVMDLAFSPDGRILATADGDGTVRQWNPLSGQQRTPLQVSTYGLGSDPDAVAFSPDGKILATASDGAVQLWNPLTGRQLGRLLNVSTGWLSNANAIAFSPDGKILATADTDGTVRLWNPATRQQRGKPLQVGAARIGGVNAVAFSPDGTILATVDSNGSLRLWNPTTGQQLSPPIQASTGALASVNGVAFSPNSRILATADSDGTVRLWNPLTLQPRGKPLRAGTGPPASVNAVAFSPDGRVLATADSDGTVLLWNPVTGQPIDTPVHADTGGLEGVHDLAFSPDGTILASADADGAVRLWSPLTGQPFGAPLQIAAAGTFTEVAGVAFSPDGKILATADSDGTIRLWNPVTRQPTSSARHASTDPLDDVSGVAFSPDSRILAIANDAGAVQFLDPVTDQPTGPFLKTINSGIIAGNFAGLAFSPDGKTLAAVAPTGSNFKNGVQLWNLATGQPIATLQTATTDADIVSDLAFSPDGKILATGDNNGTVRLWNLATRQPIGAPLQASTSDNLGGGVNAVAFSPDGKILATAGSDSTVRLWDAATRQPIGAPLQASADNASGGANGLAFSPDGKMLATAGSDGTLRLWDPATRQPIGAPLQISANGLNSAYDISFSPNGMVLADAGTDGTVSLWEVSLLAQPYSALCADFGPLKQQDWEQYAPGEPQPKACA